MRRWGIVAILMMVVLVGGCAVKPPLPPPPTVAQGQLLQRLTELQYQHRSLNALAEVKASQRDERWSSTQGLLVQQPNQLRFDVINFFGQLLLQLTVDGPELNAYVPSEKKHYQGDATLDNVHRFTGLPLAVTDLVALLLQTLPPGVLETSQLVTTGEQEPGRLTLELAPGVQYRLSFSGERLTRLIYQVNDFIVYRVDYGEALEAVDFPRRITLQVPANDLKLVLALEDVELNPTLAAQRFQLTLPPGTETVPLNPPQPSDDKAAHESH